MIPGPAPEPPADPIRMTAERFFALVDEGVLGPDDRVELLEGVVVAMAPPNPPHATSVTLTSDAVRDVLGGRAAVRVQNPLVLGTHSVPEPDVAIVAGRTRDYARAHPRTALLVVEVADWTLKQDRLTKAAIYAAAGIPEYWIVNLRADCVEVHRAPEAGAATYRETHVARRGDRLSPVSFPDVSVAVADLLPDQES